MSENNLVTKTKDLTRKFRDLIAVDHLNLEKIHERFTLQRRLALDRPAQMSYNGLLVNEYSFTFIEQSGSMEACSVGSGERSGRGLLLLNPGVDS